MSRTRQPPQNISSQAKAALDIKDTDDDSIGVIKIGHNQYIHVLDKNSLTTR